MAGIIFPIIQVTRWRQGRPGAWPVVPQRASHRAGGECGSWLCRIHGNLFGVGGTELSSPIFSLRIYDNLVQFLL